MRFAPCLLAVCLQILAARCQVVAPTVTRDELPPSTLLSDDLNAFERTRSDMSNWSDVELAAFHDITAKAKADCTRIEQSPHEGEEALALARLCALGLDWDGVYSAARWYTRKSAPTDEAQHLAMGFALLLKADLSLQAIPRALGDLREMHERLSFSDDTDSILAYTLGALEVMLPEDGVTVAMLRQGTLLDVVSGNKSGVSAGRAEAEAWHALAILHTSGHVKEEQEQKDLLLHAIARRTEPLSIADQYAAQHGRTAYEWLGQKLPAPEISHSTYAGLSGRRTETVPKASLLVVEDVNAADVPALSAAVDGLRTRLPQGTQARLLLTGASVTPAGRRKVDAAGVHAQFTEATLLTTFAADGGPLLVLLDSASRIVWLGTGTVGWFNPQQQAETLLSRQFPN